MPVALGVNGGVLGSNNLPSSGSAKGIWTPNEIARAVALGFWPVNYASSLSESATGSDAFTVGAAADEYFEYTTLLLPGNGTNGAQNNTFLDGSTNNFTITRNGNTTQGTFSPFSQTGWGNYFNGSSYLSAGTTLFNYTTGNASTTTFTIEAFIYLNSYQTAANIFHNPCIIGKGDVYLNLGVNGSGNLIFYHYDGTIRSITGSSVIPLATWTYVAVTVTGGTATLYVNGTSVGSGTWYGIQAAGQNTTSLIGRASTNASSLYINGYISNLRVSTVARTIATPTTAYTNDANTALLTAQSNRFIDNSSSPITLTVTGSPTVVAFSPFNPTESWSAATYGGSGYFDGSGDYLTTTMTGQTFGTGNFTVEFWVNPLSVALSDIIDTRPGTDNAGAWCVQYDGTNLYWSGDGTNVLGVPVAQTPIGSWTHVAYTRESGTMKVWINGTQYGSSVTKTNNYTQTRFDIGTAVRSYYFKGYISSLRTITGTAVYTANFTPPTAPLTAITNTSILLNFTNAGVYDATSKNDLETVGNAQISTTQSKFGGSSMYFDGTGDYLVGPSNNLVNFGTGAFTIEGWVYALATPSDAGFFTNGGAATGSLGFYFLTGYLRFDIYGGGGFTATTLLPLNQWVHIACVRSGNTVTLYQNGTSVGSSTITDNNTSSLCYVGTKGWDLTKVFNGYMQDVRITKGIARYTSNFTAPTAAFPTL